MMHKSLKIMLLTMAWCGVSACTCGEPLPGPNGDAGGSEPVTQSDGGTPPGDAPDSGMPAGFSPHDDVSFADSVTFLFSGTNARQKGVTAGAIELKRVAVLRGQVFDVAMNPLPGVKVSVLGKNAFGYTLTQADGWFDLAVNGGEQLTLSFEKGGVFPSQRTVTAQWNTFAFVDDVVMVPLDEKVTTLQFGAGQAQLVAGTESVDSDGKRTARFLLPAGVGASMTLPSGEKKPLTTGAFRATEYTLGVNGRARMPGTLPDFSGYTYAVELSFDEALAANATAVEFSQPGFFYIDNFLKFKVGSVVPVGFYERSAGHWLPSKNGRVIAVVDVVNGAAAVDVDGDGKADTQAVLEALQLTDAELRQLGGVYGAGAQLWRVEIAHLTPWDFNWPYGPPMGVRSPQTQKPRSLNKADEPDCNSGSIIGCQTQTLGETFALAGTNVALVYNSERQFGYNEPYTLQIPLVDEGRPPGGTKTTVEIQVAGQRHVLERGYGSNETIQFTWDGKDAYGRTTRGLERVTGRTSYRFPLQYYATRADFQTAWANAPEDLSVVGVGRAEVGVERSQTWTSQLGANRVDRPQFSGMTLSIHHAFDVDQNRVVLGSGSETKGKWQGPSIRTLAGNGDKRVYQEKPDQANEGPALTAPVGPVASVLPLPDGSTLVGEPCRIRKVDTKGVIRHVAGLLDTDKKIVCGFSGDGGPAAQAALNYVGSLARSPDGTIVVADTVNQRLRRIRLDGVIETVAGNGTMGFSGDGGDAKAAQFSSPVSAAVDKEGVVYVADRGNDRIRRIGLDGVVSTFAGGGLFNDVSFGDRAAASKAYVPSPSSVAVGPDGAVYLAHVADKSGTFGGTRARRVGLDGVISTVAGGGRGFGTVVGEATTLAFNGDASIVSLAVRANGNLLLRTKSYLALVDTLGFSFKLAGGGSSSLKQGDGGPAGQCDITLRQPYDRGTVAFGPNDDIYVADTSSERIRVISPSPFTRSFDEISMPSPSGAEVWVFSLSGRHLRTLDAVMGTTLLSFNYSKDGLLTSVVDIENKTLSIERLPEGAVKAIVGPYGHRTAIEQNEFGFISSLTNPLSERVELTIGQGGLLTQMKDARGSIHTYEYDAVGRLVKDSNPAGGFQRLNSTQLSTTKHEVTVATAEGRVETYLREEVDLGEKHLRTFRNGTTSIREAPNDGTRRRVSPEGIETTEKESGDARFGFQSPLTADMRVTMPSGQRATSMTESNAVEYVSGDFASGIATFSSTHTLFGRPYTSTWVAADKTWTTSTPEGRLSRVTVDAKGKTLVSKAPGVLDTVFTYDADGRVETATQGTRTLKYAYNAQGLVEKLTDALGRETTFTYNAAGRPTASTGPGNRTIAVESDAHGNIVSLAPPGAEKHAMAYTPVDLLQRYAPPLANAQASVNATDYSYNLDQELVKVTLPGGGQVVTTYDAAKGRVTAIDSGLRQVGFAYDAAGRVSALSSSAGAGLSFVYDGRLQLETKWSGAQVGVVRYDYDNDFYVNAVSVNGAKIDFTFDKDKLLASAGALTLARQPETGFLTGTALGVVATTQRYTPFGELQARMASAKGATLFSEGRAYDALGRLESKTETVEGVTVTQTYGYAAAGWLESVKSNGAEVARYAYDSNGNRTSVTEGSVTRAATYDGEDRLQQLGSATYTHNALGQLTTKTDGSSVTRYQYDALGKLLSVTLPGGVVIDYGLDAAGRRVGKKVNGVSQKGWLYDGPLRVVAQTDASGTVTQRYVYATQNHSPDYIVAGAQTYRLLKDTLGSVRLVVDTVSGLVVQRLDYDTWGKVTKDTAPGFQPFGYAGGLYDSDTGLTRFGARDYDAESGRWTAKDPMGFAAGDSNLYGYVGNSPQNWVDATGLRVVLVDSRASQLAERLRQTPQGRAIYDWLDASPLDYRVRGAALSATGGTATGQFFPNRNSSASQCQPGGDIELFDGLVDLQGKDPAANMAHELSHAGLYDNQHLGRPSPPIPVSTFARQSENGALGGFDHWSMEQYWNSVFGGGE